MASAKPSSEVVYDINTARDRWLSVCKRWQGCGSTEFAFATFLGNPYDGLRGTIVDTTDPEVMRKIDLINGPNGDTILKMMEIKYLEGKKVV